MASGESPVAFISNTASELADEVAEVGPDRRFEPRLQAAIISTTLRPRFDLETSGRLILQSHWKTATPELRAEFVSAFYDYLVRSYGKAIAYFHNETVEVLDAQPPLLGQSYKVHVLLTMHDGEVYQVQFYLRQNNQSWSIVDVVVDGVSYVKTYRSDFGALARREGLSGLIDWLRSTTDN